MAKGVEDTAFYRYFRLAALNEVGGSPGRFGSSVDEFHEANARARGAVPAASAHDVHARHEALAGRALAHRRADVARRQWAERVRAWHERARRARRRARGAARLPDARGRAADRAGAPRRVPRKGAARGQGRLELARAGRGARAAQCRSSPRARPDLEADPFLERVRDGRRAARARTAAPQADRAGPAGHLPRRRTGGSLARRPRQPAPGRLGRPAARAGGAPERAPRRPTRR